MQVCPSGCCAGCWHPKQPKGIEGGTPGEGGDPEMCSGRATGATEMWQSSSFSAGLPPHCLTPNWGGHTRSPCALGTPSTLWMKEIGPKKRKMLEVGSPAWKNLLWKKPSHPETAFCLRFGAIGVGNWGVPWAVGTTRCVVGWQCWCEWDRWGGSRTASTAGGALMGWGGCGAGRDLW